MRIMLPHTQGQDGRTDRSVSSEDEEKEEEEEERRMTAVAEEME
ncbi:hypothetical protein A2U01_0088324, partial [Trifolium medium]|nr:hypothetical protein [Trifolium medium]